MVSPTSGLTDITSSSHANASMYSMRASAAYGAQSVQVSRIVVSIYPNGFTCVEPAGCQTHCRQRPFPGPSPGTDCPCGKIAVTPVTMLVWPTSTPATSVLVFKCPVAASRWVHPCPARANVSAPAQERKWCRVAVLPSGTNEIVRCSCFVSGNIVRLRVHWA